MQAVLAPVFLVVTVGLCAVVGRFVEARPLIDQRFPSLGLAWMLAIYVAFCIRTFNDFGITVAPALQAGLAALTAPLAHLGIPEFAAVALVVVFASVVGSRLSGVSWRELGFSRGNRVGFTLAVCTAPLIAVIGYFAARGVHLTSWIGICVVVAIVEELVFRACLQTQLERAVGAASTRRVGRRAIPTSRRRCRMLRGHPVPARSLPLGWDLRLAKFR